MNTPLKLAALGETVWEDNVWVDPEIIAAARQAGALPDQELLFVQNFTLLGPGEEKTHVSATVVFRIPDAARVTRLLKGRRSEATFPAEWESDAEKLKQLTRFLDFADASYNKLVEVLGFDPRPGRSIALRIIREGGAPYFQAADGGYIDLPRRVVLNQDSSDWIWVAYPHELTHYFLLTAFPNPPRWFIEGPASFFGNKVSEALNFKTITDADREKILKWAQTSEGRGDTFLFDATWPEDGYAFGLGRGYKICMQLEALCGPDFFIKTFRHMQENQFSFPASASEKQRNEMLLSAMQAQTSEDIWAFFTAPAFAREHSPMLCHRRNPKLPKYAGSCVTGTCFRPPPFRPPRSLDFVRLATYTRRPKTTEGVSQVD